MNRKQRSRSQPAAKIAELPADLPQQLPPKSKAYLTKQWLDEVAAGTEKNIHDTPAWKAAVQRLGLKEVRRRLRLGCLASQYPGANPLN
ncbi:MAG: hypothetical protein WAO02_15610 [Verrucomicrobiia bacterium]